MGYLLATEPGQDLLRKKTIDWEREHIMDFFMSIRNDLLREKPSTAYYGEGSRQAGEQTTLIAGSLTHSLETRRTRET